MSEPSSEMSSPTVTLIVVSTDFPFCSDDGGLDAEVTAADSSSFTDVFLRQIPQLQPTDEGVHRLQAPAESDHRGCTGYAYA